MVVEGEEKPDMIDNGEHKFGHNLGSETIHYNSQNFQFLLVRTETKCEQSRARINRNKGAVGG